MKMFEFVVGTHGQARHMDQMQVVPFVIRPWACSLLISQF